MNKNCDDIIFIITYCSFIKLKWCFERVMQNVVALIKLTKQVSLICFSWALYRVARVMRIGTLSIPIFYFFKTLASFTSTVAFDF